MKNFAAALLCFACACTAPSPAPTAMSPALDAREVSRPTPQGQAAMSLLVRFLTGTWETIPQPENMGASTPQKLWHAPFWLDRVDHGERWVYAEYALPGAEDRPFRQRIYRFTESDGVITAAVFELPGPATRFVREWAKPQPFAAFKPADLEEQRGCRIRYLQQMDVIFNGGTAETTCPSGDPGAHHQRMEFFLTSSTLRTFESPRDAADKVLGRPSGPSEFRKILQIPG